MRASSSAFGGGSGKARAFARRVAWQCRAARALVGWSQDELAEASKVGKATIANFELGKTKPYGRTLDDLIETLEAAGVEFIAENGGGSGVRLRKG